MPKRLTTEEFIKKSKKIHGDKYDYSLVNYGINQDYKVIIICKKHGEFLQSPGNHLYGCGCMKCGIEKVASLERSTLNNFISKSSKLHDDQYNYSKVIYLNAHKKVEIICKIHGSFFQKPNNHLLGRGCKKCGVIRRSSNKKSNTEEFIKKANITHEFQYDYSKIKYINNRQKVEVICKTHGSFWVRAGNHISNILKRGCPHCSNRVSKQEKEFLNYIKISNTKEFRQKFIGKYQVDAISKNKIFEFLGDYWHGNPDKFDLNQINEISKKTFNELYVKTIEKFNTLNNMGYSIYYMWENDWNNWKKKKIKTFPIKKYNGIKI